MAEAYTALSSEDLFFRPVAQEDLPAVAAIEKVGLGMGLGLIEMEGCELKYLVGTFCQLRSTKRITPTSVAHWLKRAVWDCLDSL